MFSPKMLGFGSWLFNLLSAITLLAAVFYCYMRYQHTYWKRRGVRSVPNVHWLFGNLKNGILQRQSPGPLFGDLHRQGSDSDDVIGIYILHKPFLLVRNAELIKQILIKDFHLFPNRNFGIRSSEDKIGSMNLFSIENPEWKYLRTKMSPVFTSGKIKKLFHLMVESGNSMKEYVDSQFENGSDTTPIILKDSVTKYTSDVISTVAFGVRTNSFQIPEPEFFTQSVAGTKPNMLRGLRFFFIFFFPAIGQYLGGTMLGSGTDYLRKLFWNSMDTREATKTKRGDLIDSLIDLKNAKQDGNFKFEGDTLLSQSAIFLVAGRETSVTAMSFALCELAKHPDIQKKVREEIMEKIETHGFTYEAVQQMKYLAQVIAETLRLYPPAPLIDRKTDVDYKIPGSDIVIEKGTPLYVSLYGLHYDPRYHPDPTRFNPDRFSDEKKAEIPQCSYMPFGEGPRICIGMRVGQLQTTVGLITILKNYEVSLNPMYKCEADPRNVFTSPMHGFRLNYTKLS